MRNKQFREEDWLYWFRKYETNDLNWSKYFKVRDLDVSKKYSIDQAKKRFRNKYILYKTHGSHIIENMCGKENDVKRKKILLTKKLNHPKFFQFILVYFFHYIYKIFVLSF